MPPVPTRAPRPRRVTQSELILLIIALIAIVVLVKMLFGFVSLKHEVDTAKTLTNHVASDVRSKNAADAFSLGDPTFKSKNTKAQLQLIFQSVDKAIAGTSSIVHQAVTNSKGVKSVSIIYKFEGRQPYFVRISVSKQDGAKNWQLIGLAGDKDESKLL